MVDDSEAGFTLLEVVVALAIVALCLGAMGAVVSTNLRGVRSLEQHVTLIEEAQRALAIAVPNRDRLAPGTTNIGAGRLQVTPLGEGWDVAAGKAGWLPELVSIRVRTASGGMLDLQTVRLAREPHS